MRRTNVKNQVPLFGKGVSKISADPQQTVEINGIRPADMKKCEEPMVVVQISVCMCLLATESQKQIKLSGLKEKSNP